MRFTEILRKEKASGNNRVEGRRDSLENLYEERHAELGALPFLVQFRGNNSK